jgi:hypothetical protein
VSTKSLNIEGTAEPISRAGKREQFVIGEYTLARLLMQGYDAP